MLVTMEITLNYFSSFGSHSGNFFPLSKAFSSFFEAMPVVVSGCCDDERFCKENSSLH